ncbi:peptidylprolyl isomerase [Candidatus Dependentiae bacterium]|nr:peptidylprolyl isomerase [Candidatus Dependentiae bacterium]
MKKLHFLILGLILIGFLMFSGCEGCKKEPVIEKPKPPEPGIIAKVGSDFIREKDIDKLVSPFVPINITPKLLREVNIKKNEILKEFIFIKLLRQKADQEKFTVTKEQIDKQLKVFYNQYTFKDQFNKDLIKWNMSTEEFTEKYIKEWAIANSYLKAYYKKNINPTEEDLKIYYKNNPDKFRIASNVKFQQILFIVPPKADQKTIDEKMALAKKVHKLTEDGKTPFAQLVKKYSEDKQYEKQNGILTGVTKEGLMFFFTDPKIIDQIFALQPKEISPIVKGRMGFYIIKMISRGEEKLLPFEKTRPVVEGNYIKDKEEELKKQLRKQLEAGTEIIIYKEYET